MRGIVGKFVLRQIALRMKGAGSTMKIIELSLTILAAISGFVAAYFWMRSALVPITPPGDFEPVEQADKAEWWTVGIMDAFQKSAALNKKAAAFTAISVTLAAIAGIVQVFA